VANPVGQIWSAAMMLDHWGEHDASASIMRAIETVLATPAGRTRDLAGTVSTEECGKAVASQIG
jgi:tartrate dehydrogenase/decarboxylase/D-malate dehydrogenase